MAIVFYSRSNTSTEGTDEVNIGQGTFQSGGVVLQGFYMSNGIDTDAEVKSIKAWIGEERFSENGGDVICEYDYACEMKSYYSSASTTNIRSLIIAETS